MKQLLKQISASIAAIVIALPCIAGRSPADSLPATIGISVESYNILSTRANFKSHWDNRREAFGRIVLQEDNFPDVIGFQECQEEPQMQDIISMLGEEYDHYLSPEQEMSARLIMWKKGMFRLADSGFVDLAPGKYTEEKKGGRYASFVRLCHLETGREFYLYNLHVRTGSKIERVAQRKEMIDYLAVYAKNVSANSGDLPIIVMGDMNSYPETVLHGIPSSRMSWARHGFTDTFDMTENRTNADYSTYNTQQNVDDCTFTYAPGGKRRIDYIVVWPADRFNVLDYRIVLNFTDKKNHKAVCPLPSDHNPVRSNIEIKY